MADGSPRRTARWAVRPQDVDNVRVDGVGARGARPAPLVPHDIAAAQQELTGVTWSADEIDLTLIRPRPVDQAAARFRAALPDLVWNAAALEGNTITLPEVQTLLDGVTIGGHRIEEVEQVRALGEGYELLMHLVSSSTFRLNKETTDRLHTILARSEALESGAFRGEGHVTGGGAVRLSSGGVVEGVPQEELPRRWALLMDFLHDASQVSDPRLRALIYNAAATRAQFYFDGNKRTARLMMVGELMSHGFDAVHVPFSRRLEFNVALDELFRTDDATALMRFTASCAAR